MNLIPKEDLLQQLQRAEMAEEVTLPISYFRDLVYQALNGITEESQLQAQYEALEKAEQQRDELLAALEAHQAAQAMPIYGDYTDFVWPKIEMRKPGETAWGWICEKHGLGYQGGCICCRGDFDAHKEKKDRAARWARDDALKAASDQARSAIAKVKGGAA